MTRFTRKVATAKEYREMVESAKALGFDVSETYASGSWDTSDGDPVWPKDCDIKKVGWKYFHISLTTEGGTEVFKCKPVSDDWCDDGYLRVTFSD